MKKPARKKRGKGKPPPPIVLRSKEPIATFAIPIKKSAPNPQGGRPKIEITPELADEICHRIAHGAVVHRLGEDMPSHDVISRWRDEHEWFRVKYTRAIEDRNELWAAEIVEISDTPQEGEKVESSDKFGDKITRGDMLEHRRLRVDSRRWLLSKLSPKFKDKVDVNHGGQPDGAPIKTEATITAVDPVEAMRQYQEMMTKKD
jgi:hypothetical protein